MRAFLCAFLPLASTKARKHLCDVVAAAAAADDNGDNDSDFIYFLMTNIRFLGRVIVYLVLVTFVVVFVSVKVIDDGFIVQSLIFSFLWERQESESELVHFL